MTVNNPSFWSESWVRHVETYLASPPRCGIWLHKILGNRSLSVLECAGGSCRDSRYLFSLGYRATGSDYDEQTLTYLQQRFAVSTFQVSKQDAFAFTYDDHEFDVVFHNGFWIYFDEDLKLVELLREQSRVANGYAIALVHNIENKGLIKAFNEKSAKDVLYKIRFFDRRKLWEILERSQVSYQSFTFEKFGGPVDRLYTIERIFPMAAPLVRWVVPRLYRFQPWSMVERVALIVRLY